MILQSDTFVSRSATVGDVDTIRNLVCAAYARWVPIIGREPLPMIADYLKAVHEHRIELLQQGASLVGLIEMVSHDDHLWIENVAVVPDQQGKGIGKRLLAIAETTAIQAGHSELRLVTNGAFEINVGLYQSIGYVITETRPFMGGTAIYMAKRLKGVTAELPA